jgi:purine-nucleoside phosphorylase
LKVNEHGEVSTSKFESTANASYTFSMVDAWNFIRSRCALKPSVGVVLGSGLGRFADALSDGVRLPYRDIPGLPVSTAVGHRGELVIGMFSDIPLAVMSGRFHLYEGYTPQQVVSGIRLFRELGVRRVVLTNAAGGINPAFEEGALVLVSDHINLQGMNPLIGPNEHGLESRFPDMTEAYPAELRELAKQTAAELGIRLHEGVYAGMLGPSYETPAEIRFLRTIGADLVGMSTVPEAIAANHLGMEVLGISCVTNIAAGLSGRKLSHEEVLEIGRRVSATVVKLLGALLPKLA